MLKPRLAARLRRLAAAALLLAAAPVVLAQELAPDQLMRTLSDEVIASIRQEKDVRTVVEAKILPHFDFARATQMALGAHWRRATPEQQDRLIREFRTLLVRTYSGALASYSGQTIEFRPLRAGAADTEVTVRSHVRQPGAQPVEIDYDMQRSGAAWKVFDVRIGGISLIANYRTSFAEEVRNRGVEGLIQSLSSKNRDWSG